MIGEECQVVRATDYLNGLREEFNAPDTTEERRERLRPILAKAKGWCSGVQADYERAYGDAHAAAPTVVREVRPGLLSVSTTVDVTYRATYVNRTDPGHAAALAQLQEQQSKDAYVAEVAFRVWGWHGAVRIDWYGDTAYVTDGGRRLRVQLA